MRFVFFRIDLERWLIWFVFLFSIYFIGRVAVLLGVEEDLGFVLFLLDESFFLVFFILWGWGRKEFLC